MASRSALLAGPLLLLLGAGGCGDTPWSTLPAAIGIGGAPRDHRPVPGRELPLGLDGPAAPGATEAAGPPALRVTLGSRSARAALLQELGERRLWRTDAGFVVATDGARVVATAGLREMLAATRFDGPDPLQTPQALLDRAASARRLVDLMTADRDPAGMRFGVEIECRLRAQATTDPAVLLVEEGCRGPGGRFTNRFWVEAESGAVLRSEQWIGPRLPLLTLEPAG